MNSSITGKMHKTLGSLKHNIVKKIFNKILREQTLSIICVTMLGKYSTQNSLSKVETLTWYQSKFVAQRHH